ncbi:hypothetical protein [Dehalogenimonas etheniformans]|uniref:Uncharacterized protein n=1 Tax=Dehalogenimonas etheniformans TaxID=1536648 RepID=A0A2P5P6V0_9CHLR|nr:hypothetical protein [Dehalogenimonas etheniformans]PPD58023.1 hypothetical protein JP09_006955 [Dehalogenimonas etheniformans]QNT75373.1 hypothetical protein HX448_01040 [Dehalogenimonas etheniformans]
MKIVIGILLAWLAIILIIGFSGVPLKAGSAFADIWMYFGQPLIPIVGLVIAVAVRALLEKKSA